MFSRMERRDFGEEGWGRHNKQPGLENLPANRDRKSSNRTSTGSRGNTNVITFYVRRAAPQEEQEEEDMGQMFDKLQTEDPKGESKEPSEESGKNKKRKSEEPLRKPEMPRMNQERRALKATKRHLRRLKKSRPRSLQSPRW